jgi:hypothetical protein
MRGGQGLQTLQSSHSSGDDDSRPKILGIGRRIGHATAYEAHIGRARAQMGQIVARAFAGNQLTWMRSRASAFA